MNIARLLSFSFSDLIRSRWLFIYFGFYLVLTTVLFMMSGDVTKVIITLLNIVLIMSPLMAILITTMYYYNSRDFLEFLLAQPLSRSSVVLGLFGGIVLSLMISLVFGIGLPAIFFGVFRSAHWVTLAALLGMGCLLSCIFSGMAMLVSLRHENRIKGFGIAILIWLFLALIYDGIVLLGLLHFKDYPLEKFAIASMMFNPIDLARTLILLKLDISALMGYTGAVIQKFYSGLTGIAIISVCLLIWVLLPLAGIIRVARRKDW